MEKNGSPPPRFSTDEGRTYFLVELPVHPQLPRVQAYDEDQVAAQVLTDTEKRILLALADCDRASNEIAVALGHSKLSRVAKQCLKRLESIGLIELTIPDKPRSRIQRRRLTASGKTWVDRQSE